MKPRGEPFLLLHKQSHKVESVARKGPETVTIGDCYNKLALEILTKNIAGKIFLRNMRDNLQNKVDLIIMDQLDP